MKKKVFRLRTSAGRVRNKAMCRKRCQRKRQRKSFIRFAIEVIVFPYLDNYITYCLVMEPNF